MREETLRRFLLLSLPAAAAGGIFALLYSQLSVLSLPLFGKVNSLNASVALGIAAYEVVRARLGT